MKKAVCHLLPGLLVLLFACHSKKKDSPAKEKFFPVLSYIKSQVAHIDTSLYSLKKITFIDSIRTDTTYYRREHIRELAVDFLNIPDIFDDTFSERFKEYKQFDQTLNKVIITYTPVNPEKEEIQRQEILITPAPEGDKVSTIIIDHFASNKDSMVQKRLLWQVDKSFQVVTTKQLPGRPETNTTFKVIWNEDETY
ncbi:MAG: hypothetical protein JNK14_08490 [Chitinophagaceae bacterium]|nr:hypothetical protein [Chitinophagaceae bacterium]